MAEARLYADKHSSPPGILRYTLKYQDNKGHLTTAYVALSEVLAYEEPNAVQYSIDKLFSEMLDKFLHDAEATYEIRKLYSELFDKKPYGDVYGEDSYLKIPAIPKFGGSNGYHRPDGSFFKAFPCLRVEVEMPEGSMDAGARHVLEDAIIQLNDGDNWSREEIAKWLRQLEADGKINQKAVVAVD